MSEPYIGEICMFAGNYAPRSWAFCDGQLLSIAQNTALFSLFGTTYGGDGRTTFGLPDLQGRAAMHPGRGPGLSTRRLGEKSGVETVTLNLTQIPSHTHTATAVAKGANIAGTSAQPTGKTWADPKTIVSTDAFVNGYANATPDETMKSGSVAVTLANTGGTQNHTNIQPYQCVNFIVALQGVYPTRG